MEYNVQELKKILQMDQKTLKETLNFKLQKLGYEVISRDGFLYAPGSIPVLLIAHLDTVHKHVADIICFSEDMRFIMSPYGIGGDDRCGVYMILQLISKLKCHVLFCEDEEIGCVGANKFVASNIKPDVKFIIEMDRKGDNDAVFYYCKNEKFMSFVAKFGFLEAPGTSSDIVHIAPHLNTAAVNISSGYYNAHRQHECIDMYVVEKNIGRIAKMIEADCEHFDFY